MVKKREKDARKRPTQKQLSNYKAIASQMSSCQNQKILKHLIRYGRITSKQAIDDYNCLRLAARISDIKDMGIGIECEMVYKKKNGEHTHYGVYYLI